MSQPERDTRLCIVDTAERLFKAIGYQKTTVADIAKTLRMSPANVYRFFDSKKSINEAVLERYKGEQEQALLAVAGQGGTASSRLREMLLTVHRMNQARFADQQRMQEMVCTAMEESWEAIIAHVERLDGVLQTVVSEGIASGEFRDADAAKTTQCLRTAMTRFYHPLVMSQAECMPGPNAEEMIDFLMAALRKTG